ncbi:MAG TPA: LuxR C-terminal-related transcriptional regulator [Myxococcota bacterium]|nr:LuxR C-terminal-related transcriptional regulator [Myxococcota bacterium]
MLAPIPHDHLVLELYRLTQVVPPPEFCDGALCLMKAALPFDSALWASFAPTPAGPQGQWSHLHEIPAAMLEEYERVKQHDVVNQKLISGPGHTANVDLEQAASVAHPDIVAHARRWRMEHTLATALLEPALGLFSLLSLYRAHRSRPFSEAERQLKEVLMPHLVAAWHMNAIHFLAAPPGPGRSLPRARARIDRFGHIYNAEPGLAALLRREYQHWQGPSLPKALLTALAGSGEHNGEQLVTSLVRALEDGTFVVCVRPRARADGLSQRELEVARAFASGLSHKEIAESLGTSPATVRSQIRAAYEKLGISSKVELLRQVDELG